MPNLFKVVSLSYRIAPLHVRGLFTLNDTEAKQLMLRIKEYFLVSEVLVLSTCNRTEIYYSSLEDLNEGIIKLLLIEKQINHTEKYLSYFKQLVCEEDTVRHLFEVSLGLHSQVIGDMQIINQVKQAYQCSIDLDLAGPFLHRLLHTIFFASKRVVQQTAFRDGACSASYATVELLKSLVQNPKILVVGLGEIGTDVVKNLPPGAQVTLVNRTKSKAEELGSKYGHRTADFDDVESEIAVADTIISSIVMDKPFFTKDMLVRSGSYTFKYLIDLSVPISVSPDVEDIPGVLIYNIDGIRARTDESLAQRMQAIPMVNHIISEAISDFDDWSKRMVMQPVVQQLKQALEQIRSQEIARATKGLSPQELENVERITSSIIQKIIKQPVLQLKQACKQGEPEILVEALQDLFNLDKKDLHHSINDY